MMQWWSDYLEACRESYAPPYTIGKISLSHSILTNPTHLENYHHLYRRWFYIDFYHLHDEKHLFYPKKEDNRVTEESKSDSIVFGQSGCEVRKQLLYTIK